MADLVDITVDFSMPKNSYNISYEYGNLNIRASSGVAATKAFYTVIQDGQSSGEVAWEGIQIDIDDLRRRYLSDKVSKVKSSSL